MVNFNDIYYMVLMIISLLFAVTIHEVGHGYVAWKMGDNTAMLAGRLTLNPVKHLDFFGSFLLPVILKFSGAPFIFGYAKPVPVNFTNLRDFRKGTIYVAAAGALANFACAVISGILFQVMIFLGPLWYGSVFKPIIMGLLFLVGYSVIINSILAVFNLIPIPPLDGSRIFVMFLPEALRLKYMRIERYGMLIILLLLIFKQELLFQIIYFFIAPLLFLLLGSEGISFITSTLEG